MAREDGPPALLTASQLASYCDVDLKTIHNWADRGRVRCSRTKGRHLRIRRADALDFLRRYGYRVPVELLDGKPRVANISGCLGEAELTRLADEFEIVAPTDLAAALIALGSTPPDAAVIAADSSGLPATMLTRAITEAEATRHVRVVVYTPHAELSRDVLAAGAAALVIAPDPAALSQTLSATLGVGR